MLVQHQPAVSPSFTQNSEDTTDETVRIILQTDFTKDWMKIINTIYEVILPCSLTEWQISMLGLL